MNYVYILECEDGSFYTGWTDNLEKRFAKHCAGKGAKYTRSHKPVRIGYYETFETPKEAQSREWHLKRLSHAQKAELIEGFENTAIHCD